MENMTFELDNYTVSTRLPMGGDIDAVTVLSRVPELNKLSSQEVVDALTALGCVAVTVSAR